MTNGKVITMHLKNGNMNNIVKVNLANWNGSVIKLPRTEINEYKDDDCSTNGIYFLIGKTNQDDKDFVYLGESRNVIKRLKEHISKNKSNIDDENKIGYWNTAIIVVGKDLDITSTKYLEWKFFNIIKESNNYILKTKITGKDIFIKDFHKDIMKEFLSNAITLISTLCYGLFDRIESKDNSSIQYFYCSNNRNANAKGYQNENGFVVTKGSIISKNVVDSFLTKGYFRLREKLIEDKIIVNFVFQKDYQFNSPSAAGSVVLGRMYYDDWKTKEGKKFSELKI